MEPYPKFWEVSRAKPSWWCWLFHFFYWVSNDFGTWHTSGRKDFEVKCLRCGECWTEKVKSA